MEREARTGDRCKYCQVQDWLEAEVHLRAQEHVAVVAANYGAENTPRGTHGLAAKNGSLEFDLRRRHIGLEHCFWSYTRISPQHNRTLVHPDLLADLLNDTPGFTAVDRTFADDQPLIPDYQTHRKTRSPPGSRTTRSASIFKKPR